MAVLVAAFSACSREKTEAPEILWDTWGVPHVFASNEKELFHAFGWAQIFSHKELRPARRTRPEIEAHLEAREVF